MKRAAALLLLARLLLALSGCGCGGLEPALEAVCGWDAARRWGCRFNALRAEGALVVAARSEAGGAMSAQRARELQTALAAELEPYLPEGCELYIDVR